MWMADLGERFNKDIEWVRSKPKAWILFYFTRDKIKADREKQETDRAKIKAELNKGRVSTGFRRGHRR